MPDDANRVALMYGPLALAGDLGTEDDAEANNPMYVPVIMAEERKPLTWTEPIEGEINSFITKEVGRPRDIEFKPFYKTHERRYSVYFDLFNATQWDELQIEYKAKQEEMKKMERMTIDYFQLGEMQPERDHNFESEKSWVFDYKHKKYREADRGGWFSFEMGVYAGQPMKMAFEYWGGFPGSKTFDILVNDTKIATENISNARPGEFYFKYYDIPDEFTVNGGKVKVKCIPHDGHRAGPVFSVRMMKR
jgi:hypothetical protein